MSFPSRNKTEEIMYKIISNDLSGITSSILFETSDITFDGYLPIHWAAALSNEDLIWTIIMLGVATLEVETSGRLQKETARTILAKVNPLMLERLDKRIVKHREITFRREMINDYDEDQKKSIKQKI